ncbi:hypothetical protein CMI39_01340 [Candidatus Pacearchaeota archaeon]|jgi:hypothetical protein|nr:hypothetical protein [Candidatus Pacearchaeota archaeon]|tara:strand:- start:286 stop:585 length:300 start_codon:yes stop_codon:yes gene_type:complete
MAEKYTGRVKGNVRIFKYTGEYGEVFTPVFFKSNDNSPKKPKKIELDVEVVKDYRNIETKRYSLEIAQICSDATSAKGRNATIKEDGLISKLNKLLLEK